jgi:uncharacterized DUF497 family protein
MQFEWDAAKAAVNFAKHNLEFAQAIVVFRDPSRLTVVDRRHAAERRENTTGLIEGHLVTVTHTDRAGVIRLISARPASRQERNRYHAHR